MCLLINCSAYASCKLPKGFTYLRDVDNSINQTISFATSDNCIGHRLAGYEAQEAICTLALAKELKKVQNSLKKINPHYSLSILDIYRPTDAVQDIINWAKDKDDIKTKQRCYPDLDKSELLGDYVASVKSAHSRGSTVDIIILDTRTKQPLDFGPRFFGKYVHVNYSGLTPIQKENRLMLRNLMTKHHFKPYDKEFWHFTLLNEPFPQTQFNFKICNPFSIQGDHPMTDASEIFTFKNQYGSLLEYQVKANNIIEGYFTTAVSTSACPQAAGTKQPITGHVVGNAIAFTVAYPMCGSLLSISGNLSKDGKAIETFSILSHQAEDINYKPGFRLIGHGNYLKVETKST